MEASATLLASRGRFAGDSKSLKGSSGSRSPSSLSPHCFRPSLARVLTDLSCTSREVTKLSKRHRFACNTSSTLSCRRALSAPSSCLAAPTYAHAAGQDNELFHRACCATFGGEKDNENRQAEGQQKKRAPDSLIKACCATFGSEIKDEEEDTRTHEQTDRWIDGHMAPGENYIDNSGLFDRGMLRDIWG